MRHIAIFRDAFQPANSIFISDDVIQLDKTTTPLARK
jgi:hypothetical protein